MFPEWYFWPFYAILRAFTVDIFGIPAKLLGVIAMFGSIILLFFLPWLDKSPVRSGNYRPTFKLFFWLLVADVLVLGYCGGSPAEEPFVMISQVASAYYFAHFLIILPLLSMFERTLPLPRVHYRRGPFHPTLLQRVKRKNRIMVRFIGFLAGLGFVAILLFSAIVGAYNYISEPPAPTVEHEFHLPPKPLHLASDGAARPFRPSAAPARLSGLQGSLLGLPLDESCRLPRPDRNRLHRAGS